MKEIDLQVGGPLSTQEHEILVFRRGNECAAWLLGKHRKKFRHGGEASFRLPPGTDAPLWFQVAIDYLRTYATEKWKVGSLLTRSGRYVLIQRVKPSLGFAASSN